MSKSKALKHNGGNDYTLKPDEESVWVTVGNFSVYIIRREGGSVEAVILPLGHEADNEAVGARATSESYPTE